MNYTIVKYILINYVIAMAITIYAIVEKMHFIQYIKILLPISVCLNVLMYFFRVIIKTLELKEEKGSFEVDIPPNLEEMKELLYAQEQESEQEIRNPIEEEKTQEEDGVNLTIGNDR